MIVAAAGLEQIDKILGVAQVGKIGLDGEHDLVGGEQRLLYPGVPRMRQVEDDGRHARLGDVDDMLEGAFGEVVGAVEGGRRCKQAQVIGATGEQAIEEVVVEPVGRGQRLGDAL